MIDFTQQYEHLNWDATNDNVMGGISSGTMTYSNGRSLFSGVISLENNGGFSSVNRPIQPLGQTLPTLNSNLLATVEPINCAPRLGEMAFASITNTTLPPSEVSDKL
ncbi:hypothetical protein JCM19239_3289 [Vibrio variabilis]|uniref:NADH:ubiquinone oxidoreductase intermediate-associated protein 30 domain-containing protein n=1 Tax=Vibrio variabilis TaxID=990271 RepID=A0ABQ0JFZ2_9VIBR|nr:hypothetical protein JCM19239_3289 [Vibrio variabilis]